MERKEGFYLVKSESIYLIGQTEWEVARWIGGRWLLTGLEESFDDDEFTQIGPRIPIPDPDQVPNSVMTWVSDPSGTLHALRIGPSGEQTDQFSNLAHGSVDRGAASEPSLPSGG